MIPEYVPFITLAGSLLAATLTALVTLAVAYVNRGKATKDELKTAEKNLALTQREAETRLLHAEMASREKQLDFQTNILKQIENLHSKLSDINKELAACEMSKAEMKVAFYEKIHAFELKVSFLEGQQLASSQHGAMLERKIDNAVSPHQNDQGSTL